MATAEHVRTASGWRVIAPATVRPGDRIPVKRTNGTRYTATILKTTRCFASRRGPSVFITTDQPVAAEQVEITACSACGSLTADPVATADRTHLYGLVCPTCDKLPPSELAFTRDDTC